VGRLWSSFNASWWLSHRATRADRGLQPGILTRPEGDAAQLIARLFGP
jgi:hypothetical protein